MLPYAADARYRDDNVKVGYKISFTRYFDKPKPMRMLVEIRTDILDLEKETGGLLNEIFNVAGASNEGQDKGLSHQSWSKR